VLWFDACVAVQFPRNQAGRSSAVVHLPGRSKPQLILICTN